MKDFSYIVYVKMDLVCPNLHSYYYNMYLQAMSLWHYKSKSKQSMGKWGHLGIGINLNVVTNAQVV